MQKLMAVPKTSKPKKKISHSQRDKNTEERKRLNRYRQKQREIVFERDEGLCIVCLVKYKKYEPAVEIHHTLGRGSWETRNWYERQEVLISLCRSCHTEIHSIGSLSKEEVKKILNEHLLKRC